MYSKADAHLDLIGVETPVLELLLEERATNVRRVVQFACVQDRWRRAKLVVQCSAVNFTVYRTRALYEYEHSFARSNGNGKSVRICKLHLL